MHLVFVPAEPLEERLFHAVGYAGSGVLHGHHHHAVLFCAPFHPDRYAGARPAERDGVSDEVCKYLREQVVRPDLRRRPLERDGRLRHTLSLRADDAA